MHVYRKMFCTSALQILLLLFFVRFNGNICKSQLHSVEIFHKYCFKNWNGNTANDAIRVRNFDSAIKSFSFFFGRARRNKDASTVAAVTSNPGTPFQPKLAKPDNCWSEFCRLRSTVHAIAKCTRENTEFIALSVCHLMFTLKKEIPCEVPNSASASAVYTFRLQRFFISFFETVFQLWFPSSSLIIILKAKVLQRTTLRLAMFTSSSRHPFHKSMATIGFPSPQGCFFLNERNHSIVLGPGWGQHTVALVRTCCCCWFQPW